MSLWSPLLSHHFLKIYAQKIGKKVDTITPSAMESLTTARWVGNVRELENCIEAKKLALRAFERRSLSALLEKSAGNVSSAARAAGVDRSNFRLLFKQYEVGGRTMKKPGDAGYNPAIDDTNDDLELDDANAKPCRRVLHPSSPGSFGARIARRSAIFARSLASSPCAEGS